MNKLSNFFKAAIERAVRTFAQAMIGLFGAASLFSEVDWTTVLSGSAFAALLSLLTSVATGLPETPEHGSFADRHSDQ